MEFTAEGIIIFLLQKVPVCHDNNHSWDRRGEEVLVHYTVNILQLWLPSNFGEFYVYFFLIWIFYVLVKPMY